MLGLNTLLAGLGMMWRRLSATVRCIAPIGACAVLCAFLANCSNGVDNRYGVSASPRVVADGDPVPKGGGNYRVGAPYTVGGHTYYPQDDPHYHASGLASWYGDDFHGRLTANREIFDHNGISAAHPTMPLPSYARVTNLSNGRSLIVRVNDRGPYHGNRIIDVSSRAADLLGFRTSGTAWVKVEYVSRAPIEGSDDRILAATLRQDEPAPAPGTVKLAATRITPVGTTASILRTAHYVSAAASDAEITGSRSMSYAEGPRGRDGTDQFLNGRGLY
jgi:rare lipoprotein A